MRAFFKDAYGCHADLCQYIGKEITRLTIRTPDGRTVVRKEYKTWHGAKIAMGKYSDCWRNELTGKRA